MPFSLPFLKGMLGRNNQESDQLAAFHHIPSAPGGATLVAPADHQAALTPFLHGMMQASVVDQPGAVFLVGVPLETVERLYPTAQRLAPVEDIGRVSMTPASAMTALRVLLGASTLADYLLELLYLENAANELSKSGPLAMIPTWAKEQLSPEGIYRVFCSPQRADATVGSALKSLYHHPGFSFALLDALGKAAETKRISSWHEKQLKKWEAHATVVADTLGEIIDNPPTSFSILPAIRDAQNAATPGVWYIHPDDLPACAPVIDALALSHGLRQRHHWYIDAAALGDASPDGLNALERLSVALWQHRDACEGGHGPALWCNLGDEAPAVGGARSFKHRTIQASSMVLGDEAAVMNSVIHALNIEDTAFDWVPEAGKVGMFYPRRGQFRHWSDREKKAVEKHVTAMTEAV